MKNSLIILILVSFAFNSKSQQLKSIEPGFSSADYFKKSKNQIKTGLILLGGGAVMFGGGSYALEHATGKSGYGVLFIFGGMAMATASIPFFIASFSSKHKAKIFLNKKALMVTPNLKSGIVYNSIGVKINF